MDESIEKSIELIETISQEALEELSDNEGGEEGDG